MRVTSVALLGLFVWSIACCQAADRREAGIRLRALEQKWETSGQEARGRAVPFISNAVMGFFAGQFNRVCENLSRAQFALESSGEPAAERKHADSLALAMPRIAEPGQEIEFKLGSIFEAPSANLTVRIEVLALDGTQAHSVSGPTLVHKMRLPDQEGEYRAKAILSHQGVRLREIQQPLSVIANPDGKIAKIREKAGNRDGFEAATLRMWAEELENSRDGRPSESAFPLTVLVARAEKSADDWLREPGDHWWAIPSERGVVRSRVFVPEQAERGVRPLVIALHGAGGNEHMFFESLGVGKAVRETKERGWYLIAPVANAPGSVETVLAFAKKNLKVSEPRVFLIGHSMGGFMTFDAARKMPKTFAAIGAIAAGDRGGQGELPPLFLAVGEQEIGMLRQQAKSAADSLKSKTTLEFKTYPNSEHLMIVADCLPDLFKFLDKHVLGQ